MAKSHNVPFLGKNTYQHQCLHRRGDRGVRGNLDHVSCKIFLHKIFLQKKKFCHITSVYITRLRLVFCTFPLSVFSNACRVLSQCNTQLKFLYLINKKKTAKYLVWKCKGLVCWKLKECQPNSLLCQAYHIAEQIVCDLV